MRLRRIIAAVIAAALLLSGCSSMNFSRSDILTPPKASGSRAEVQRLIENDANGSYQLIDPSSGSNKSGLILHDTDNDGVNEAIALYTAADGTPRILIATPRDDQYQLTGSTELYSANVSALYFTDFNGDSKEELLLSYDAGTSQSALKMYMISDGISTSDVAKGYTDFVTGDFDGDSAPDVLLMMSANGGKSAKASLMTFSQGAFSEKSSCEIDPNVQSYISLRFCRITNDISGAAADGKLDSGENTTQLIYYDSAAKMLVNPLFMNNNYRKTARVSDVICMDIDNDGVTNIPLSSVMDHREDEDIETVCNVARWNDYDPEDMALSFKRDAILCEKLGFMLLFDTDQLKTITARYSGDNAVKLCRVSYKNSEPELGETLMTVYRYDKSSYDSSLTTQAKLTDTAAYTYTYVLSEGSTITHENIENSFMLL